MSTKPDDRKDDETGYSVPLGALPFIIMGLIVILSTLAR